MTVRSTVKRKEKEGIFIYVIFFLFFFTNLKQPPRQTFPHFGNYFGHGFKNGSRGVVFETIDTIHYVL